MSTPRQRAWVGIGSNCDQRVAIAAALARLTTEFDELQVSSVYASPCVAGGSTEYWNLAVGFLTELDAVALRARLKSIETELGRSRGEDAAGRIRIDLDLLLGTALDPSAGAVKPPRRAIIEHPHVLLPLAELLPEWRFPGETLTLAELACAAARLIKVAETGTSPAAVRPLTVEGTPCTD